MRWTGKGIMEKRNHSIFYSCKQRHHEFGTGFVVSKRVKHSVIDFEPINERLCKLRVRGKFFNYTLINGHAPTENKSEDEKDEFYEQLEHAVRHSPRHDIKIILGDMNAQVGRESIYYPTIGQHSLHSECNDNGRRLVQFATSMNMIVANTWFPHKDIHKITWKSPDGKTNNAIDHFIVDSRHASSFMDVRTFRGANIDSDHFLVGAKIRSRISTQNLHMPKNEKKINIDKLKDEELKSRYEVELNRKISKLKGSQVQNESITEEWQKYETAIKDVAKEVLGLQNPRKRNNWFDEDCKRVTAEKNKAYKDMLQKHSTRHAQEVYKEKRKAEKRIHKKKKRDFMNKELQEIEESAGEVKKFYKKVNDQRKEFTPKTTLIKDIDGNIISEKDKILQRWAHHFEELLNPNVSLRTTEENAMQHTRPQPTSNETGIQDEDIELAIAKLKNHKSPGCDNISAELLKQGGEELKQVIRLLIDRVWKENNIPDQWTTGIICPIHKKGDQLTCTNYRGITLLNTVYKIFSNVVHEKLKPHAEKIIGQYQCGFRSGRSTTDHIFAIRQITEKALEFNNNIHLLFIDFKTAYDTIKRTSLYKAMEELGIPEQLVSMTKASMQNVACKVRIDGHLSKSFPAENGLRQGDALSCVLFNIALEKIIRDANIIASGTILNKPVQIMAYADDIVILGRSLRNITETFVALEQAAAKMGLRINESKTKYMCLKKQNDRVRQNFTVGEYNFEGVNEFVYLGSMLRQDGNLTSEINRRITLASRAYYGLRRQLTSKRISRRTKLRLYTTLIKPILVYGSEAWTLRQAEINLLDCFERKILRTIFGGVQEGEAWRRRYNFELYSLYNQPSITKTVRLNRLRWLGHLMRYIDNNPTKLAFTQVPLGRRGAGRPKKRYIDDVEDDLKRLNIRNWKIKTQNRELWRKILKEAKAHPGL